MSSISDYKDRLNHQISVERARNDKPTWGEKLESLGAQDILGTPNGNSTDLVTLRRAVIDSDMNLDAAFRVAALGRIVSQSDELTAPQLPLERLADSQEDLEVRLGSLEILKFLSISSPSFSEWRPAYLEALRSTLTVPELRLVAFGVLIAQGDRHAQELLVRGLEDSQEALVSPADAFYLLSEDGHADVRVLARKFVDNSVDERSLEAAIRHLAGDPASVARLQAFILDRQKPVNSRKIAAMSLNALSPESLPVSSETVTTFTSDPVIDFVRILSSRNQKQ